MNVENSPTKPLPRTLTVLLALVVLTAFLPHRERALLLTEDGLDTLLTSDILASNSFFAPAPFGYYRGVRLDWSSVGGDPNGLRRARNAPGQSLYAQRLPTVVPSFPGAGSGPAFVPLGTNIPGGAPALSLSAPTPGGSAAGPGVSGGPGAIGTLPGGGGSGGGGSIGGPPPPPPPPPPSPSPSPPSTPPPSVAAVPEPTSWALMILGFGLIGGGLRRSRLKARAAVSA